MNLNPENYAEICKQSAFISALIAGFSFAFLGALLIESVKKKITDWVVTFSILSIAGLIICSCFWTLSASRMALLLSNNISQVPAEYIGIHKVLSVIFVSSFLFFLVTLGLSGWIRSRVIGLVSGSVSFVAIVFFFLTIRHFLV